MQRGTMGSLWVSLFVAIALSVGTSAVQAEEYWLNKTIVYTVGNNDLGEDVAVDANKNVYVAARLGNLDQENNLLVKYYPSGGIHWTRDYDQGNSKAWIKGVAVDAAGNVYVTGGTSYDGSGACLTKSYDPNGVVRWSRTHPLGYTTMCYDIAVDAAGNVTVAGIYRYEDSAQRANLLIKYDAQGNEVCSTTTFWPLPSMTSATAVDLDADGSAYVLSHIDAPGYDGIFKYDSQCAEVNGPGPEFTLPADAHIYTDIAVNESGIYVLGRGNYDVHLDKYDPSGSLLASTTYDSGGDDYGFALALDTLGNVYAAGRAGGYLTLKYDASLNLLWSGQWAQGTSDRALGISVAGDQTVYVTGMSGGIGSGGLEYNAATLVYSQTPPPPPPSKDRK